MRHEECGDVIRPRDCVLLRAGGKRNELPYVAKVAQLFENPEDGELHKFSLEIQFLNSLACRRNDDVAVLVLSTGAHGAGKTGQ